MKSTIRVNRQFGKYRIEKRIASGGFAVVYQALDMIEGVRVALKIPHEGMVDTEMLDDFRREIRLAASLDHYNILPLKNAEFINGHLVLAFPLAERTLDDRLRNRLALSKALDFSEQMLDAVSYAHEQRIIHCDIKPENFLLFPGDHLMLTDFGISKIALRTLRASGSGTIGYLAPEQAMGKPSFRSDVFSCGLVMYRMFTGELPEWPFEWPLPGHQRLRQLHPDLTDMISRAIILDPRRRFRDAGQMLSVFQRVKPRALRKNGSVVNRKKKSRSRDWRTVRRREFLKRFGTQLGAKYQCHKCQGPVSESMQNCPWCGVRRARHRDDTNLPQVCPRCNRGMKLDWHYCPWCFGPGFDVTSERHFADRRYSGRCSNRRCSRKLLMPFMKYCPWCRSKVKKKWKLDQSTEKCVKCGWGIVPVFWSFCPWCGKNCGLNSSR